MARLSMVPMEWQERWWFSARMQLEVDGRFDDCLADLDEVIATESCVVFSTADGESWVITTAGRGAVFVEMVFSQRAGALLSYLSQFLKMMGMVGYDKVLANLRGKPQERLFSRYLEKQDDYYLIPKEFICG